MEWLQRAWELVLGLRQPFLSPSTSIYWGYIASALVLATGAYYARARRTGRSLAGGWFAFIFPRGVYAHRSARHDVGVYAINTLLYSLWIVGYVSGVLMWVARRVYALCGDWFGFPATPVAGVAARVAMTLSLFVLADLAFYVAHVASHKVPWLWAFHKVHHSAPVLTPLTVMRRHPVELLFEPFVTAVLLGAGYGFFAFLSADTLEVYRLFGVSAPLLVFLLAGFNLQHSHIWMSWGAQLNRVFISPASHQIHHSSMPAHIDKNFGNALAIWDWMFGTLHLPRRGERLEIGLGSQAENARHGALWRLYCVPFYDFARGISHCFRGRTQHDGLPSRLGARR